MAVVAQIDRHDAIEHPARALDRVRRPSRACSNAKPCRAPSRLRRCAPCCRAQCGSWFRPRRWQSSGSSPAPRRPRSRRRAARSRRPCSTANTSRPFSGSLEAALAAASAAASEPFCSDTPRPRTKRAIGAFDQFTRERILHAIGRMRHRIAHQHQAAFGILRTEFDDQIAHRIAARRQAELLHQRHHPLADEALDLRLLLEFLGLLRGMAHERLRPADDVGRGNSQTVVEHVTSDNPAS